MKRWLLMSVALTLSLLGPGARVQAQQGAPDCSSAYNTAYNSWLSYLLDPVNVLPEILDPADPCYDAMLQGQADATFAARSATPTSNGNPTPALPYLPTGTPEAASAPVQPTPAVTCVAAPAVGTTPSTIVQGSGLDVDAAGFNPGSNVTFSDSNGLTWSVPAGADCTADGAIYATTQDSGGSYTVTVSGTARNGSPLSLSSSYTVIALTPVPTSTPLPTAVPTTS